MQKLSLRSMSETKRERNRDEFLRKVEELTNIISENNNDAEESREQTIGISDAYIPSTIWFVPAARLPWPRICSARCLRWNKSSGIVLLLPRSKDGEKTLRNLLQSLSVFWKENLAFLAFFGYNKLIHYFLTRFNRVSEIIGTAGFQVLSGQDLDSLWR